MKKIISTTLLLAAAVIPAFGQTETPSYETTLHLQIRPADELYGVTGVRPYYKYDMWYVRDVLTEETFAMLRPVAESPLEISGKISFYGYADLPDLKGERVVSTILLGNNEEGGSLKFNFNEDFISATPSPPTAACTSPKSTSAMWSLPSRPKHSPLRSTALSPW